MKNVCCVELDNTAKRESVFECNASTGQCVLSAGSAGHYTGITQALHRHYKGITQCRAVPGPPGTRAPPCSDRSPQILGHNSMFLSLHSELQQSTEYNKGHSTMYSPVYSVQL